MEADLGDPNLLSDAKRYRETLRDHAFLKKLETAFAAYSKTLSDIEGAESLASDPDFAEEAQREKASLEALLPEREHKVLAALLPPDPTESRNAVMEIRAGTGGEEAALFAGDLFRMYSRYCETKGWKVSVMHSNATSLDGFKEIVFTVQGEGAYGRFRFESGGHRVQRVPETEAQGRIHTSAATMIVFPEADDDDEIDIPEKDIRIDLFCAGGAGGQHVNKTESAIRMIHKPTGIVIECQDERSQFKNRDKAMKLLRAKLYDMKLREQTDEIASKRRSQVGSGDRSERIRTYNFPQGRGTDHRIGLTLYTLESFINGDMDQVIDALITAETAEKLKEGL